MSAPIVTFRDVVLGYGRTVIVPGISFAVSPGDYLGVIGPNGSGKTTLLRAILGLHRSWSGCIERRPGSRFGYCMQRQQLETPFPFSVSEMVLMGRVAVRGICRRCTQDDRRAARRALDRLGIRHLEDRPFRELSGGQRQRVIIARALAGEPHALVLDEPTSDLDLASERELLDILRTLNRDGLAVLLVSHELGNVINEAKSFVFLNAGRPPVFLPADALDGISLGAAMGTPVQLHAVAGRKVVLV